MIIFTLLLPLISSIVALCFSFSKKSEGLGWFSSYVILLSFVFALMSFMYFDGNAFYVQVLPWISALGVNYGIYIDNVSLIMSCVVTLVATCVHFYSIYYMEHDAGFNKFFSFLGLFVFCMLMLVLSDNFLMLFVGWESVGLCSWMLIGFWYQVDKYSRAANEAFIMNRVSDFAMLLGLFLLYINFGSLRFADIFQAAFIVDAVNPSVIGLIAALLFVGAMGKSAQFPFHTWLANAMAGPTPVSALIHAATMVTAGVYLLIRAHAIYDLAPNVLYFVAALGTFVALFAASMALAAKDLKRIIAFSTLSQLGYMFAAAGMGAYKLAFFHLFTHAFFKALLFLGAGNIMHAMHDELNIFKMGKLFKPMRATAILMIIASVALSGIWPLAGFFSKDKILDFAFDSERYVIYGVLLFTAFLTAFYSFRLIMMVFFAPQKHEIHPHEAKKVALFAMSPLALLAIVIGFVDEKFLAMIKIGELHLHHNFTLIAISLIVAIAGIVFAVFKYKNGAKEECNCPITKLLANEYFIAKFYDKFIVRFYLGLASLFACFEDLLYALIFKTPGKLTQKCCDKEAGNLSLHIVFVASFVLLLILVLAVIYA